MWTAWVEVKYPGRSQAVHFCIGPKAQLMWVCVGGGGGEVRSGYINTPQSGRTVSVGPIASPQRTAYIQLIVTVSIILVGCHFFCFSFFWCQYRILKLFFLMIKVMMELEASRYGTLSLSYKSYNDVTWCLKLYSFRLRSVHDFFQIWHNLCLATCDLVNSCYCIKNFRKPCLNW